MKKVADSLLRNSGNGITGIVAVDGVDATVPHDWFSVILKIIIGIATLAPMVKPLFTKKTPFIANV